MYEAHFGLSGLPFQISPDARFYVDAAPHCAALNALLAGLRRGDEFMLLTGDFGTGKTTVCRRLLQEVDPERFAVAELRAQRLEGDDLFDRIAEAFGLRPLEAHHRLAAMLQMLEDIAHGRGKALLVIDEAQAIGLDALRRLRKLTALRVDGHSVLHVCLAGRHAPAGIDDLARIGRPLALGTAFHLQPLDAADTRSYVLHRLRHAGWAGRPAFDKDVTAEIQACCEGNPARINRLCAHLLLQLYLQGRDDISAGIVRAVDTMMRSELEGEPAVADLPPAVRASAREPDTVLEPFSRPPDEAASSVDIDALTTRPPEGRLPAVRHADLDRELAPWHLVGGTAAARSPRRGRWLGAAGALALLVGGGVAWHASTGRAVTPLGVAAAPAVAVAAAAAPPLPLQTQTQTQTKMQVAETAATARTPDAPDAPGAPQAIRARQALGATGADARVPLDPQRAIAMSPPAAGRSFTNVTADADADAGAQAGASSRPAAAGSSTAAGNASPRSATASAIDAPAIAPTAAPLADMPRTTVAVERPRHRARRPVSDAPAPDEREAGTPAATASAGDCTATTEALALCAKAAPRAPATQVAREGESAPRVSRDAASTPPAPRDGEATEAPVRDAAFAVPPSAKATHAPPSRRTCDRTQAVLGLCNGP